MMADDGKVRAINGIDLDALRYKKFDGMRRLPPKEDMSGQRIKEMGPQL